jgi:hypothetical protein
MSRECSEHARELWKGDTAASGSWTHIEVRMGRFRGDNGKPDDTGIKDLISPFLTDRGALADGVKLAASDFQSRTVLVYGFDDVERPLQDALDALDVLLRQRVGVDGRCSAILNGLRHPVSASGRVTAWEILAPTAY